MVSFAVILIAILVVLVVFMNFTGQNTTAANALTESPWMLQSVYSSGDTPVPVLNGSVINASFSVDGRLAGYGGCNRYSGRYMAQETRIVISQVTTTSIACRDQNITLQEQQYYASLEEAAGLRVHNRVLTLYDTTGKPLLVFAAA